MEIIATVWLLGFMSSVLLVAIFFKFLVVYIFGYVLHTGSAS